MRRQPSRLWQVLAVGLTIAASGCQVQYVVNASYYQLELLSRREPIADVYASPELSPEDRASLDLIADVRGWGEAHGFEQTENYQDVAVGWERTVWVVSASPPLALEAETWWFPVVGRVPYLGYFTWDEAVTMRMRLEERGLDVSVREAGAYSTLGWFRDPILPNMLTWSTFHLASTVLHELAHATVWIPGDVGFNESFASFVGEEAAFLYLEDRFGAESPEVREARAEHEDWRRWRALQAEVCTALEQVYASTMPDAERLRTKAAIFASIPDRVRAGGFAEPERYVGYAETVTWNNGRLVQFLTYNDRRPVFEAVLADQDGDLLGFMEVVAEATRRSADPWAAVSALIGD